MKAVILAAGRGKRLAPYTDAAPKPMVQVGGAPLLSHILDRLKAVGIREVFLVVHYLAEKIEAHFGDGAGIGMRLSYLRQESPTGGTANALLLAEPFVSDAPFMMCWGDIETDASEYRRVIDRFGTGDCDAVMIVNYLEDISAGGAVYKEADGRVTRIVEKAPPGTQTTHWNNGGIFVFSPDVFDHLRRTPLSPRGEREIPQTLQLMVDAGRRVCAVEMEHERLDLTRPEDVPRVDQILRQKAESRKQ
jgi:NDP-sugar pyrophosphorylase family protein